MDVRQATVVSPRADRAAIAERDADLEEAPVWPFTDLECQDVYLESMRRDLDLVLLSYVDHRKEWGVYAQIHKEFGTFVLEQTRSAFERLAPDWSYCSDGVAHQMVAQSVREAALEAWPGVLPSVDESHEQAAAFVAQSAADSDLSDVEVRGRAGDLALMLSVGRVVLDGGEVRAVDYRETWRVQGLDDMWRGVRSAAVRATQSFVYDLAMAAGGTEDGIAFATTPNEDFMLEQGGDRRQAVIDQKLSEARLESRIAKERF